MGIVGGALGYRLLRAISADGQNSAMDGSAYAGKSKLEMLLGPDIWKHLKDKVVIDFGCGEGGESIEVAKHGAARVVGIDIQENLLAVARDRATQAGAADKCTFSTKSHELADVILAIDSFEHFHEPGSVLLEMHKLLKPNGCVLIAFGPTWYHPFGGHLFSIFPWAHLLFTEKALIRWRSDFKSDGATKFNEVAGGLNGMTISRFEKLVADSPLRFKEFEAVPIRKLRFVANRLTREFSTAIVRCKLVAR